MPAVLPLMRAASRSSTRRRSSTPRKRRAAPSIPAAGQNVACQSPAVRIWVEELLIFGRVHSVASGSPATGKRSFAGTRHYSRLFVEVTPWQEGNLRSSRCRATGKSSARRSDRYRYTRLGLSIDFHWLGFSEAQRDRHEPKPVDCFRRGSEPQRSLERLWFVRLNPWPTWRTRLWLAGRWVCRDRRSSTNPGRSRRTAVQRLLCPSSSARGQAGARPRVR